MKSQAPPGAGHRGGRRPAGAGLLVYTTPCDQTIHPPRLAGTGATLTPDRTAERGAAAGADPGLGAVPFILAYYRLFRPRLDRPTVTCMEALRQGLGLKGRVLFGGICEEVLTRWGLMSGLAWFGAKLAGQANDPVLWGAIVVRASCSAWGTCPATWPPAVGGHRPFWRWCCL